MSGTKEFNVMGVSQTASASALRVLAAGVGGVAAAGVIGSGVVVFVQAQAENLVLRGSRNQQLHFLSGRITAGDLVDIPR